MAETKVCEQCGREQDIEEFYRRPQKNNPECRIKLCKTCYLENIRERRRREVELQRQREEQRRREEEERNRQWEEKNREREEAYHQWYAQQPARLCIDCKQVLPATAFGHSMSSPAEEGEEFAVLPGGPLYLPILHKRCTSCHEQYRQTNRQVYPLCLMCGTPTRRYDFLRKWEGFRLDLIKVCCEQCIPRFETLPEAEQMEWLRQAIVAAYGKTAYIYGLQYREDENAEKTLWAQFKNSFFCHHIGRTKHLLRRMSEYRRGWYRQIKAHHVLEHVPFGGLSMERESRWMMHALKYGWPIDNFELLKIGEDQLGGRRQQEALTKAVAHFEPLTAPFEVIEPLLGKFLNTGDARIVHWYLEQVKGVGSHFPP